MLKNRILLIVITLAIMLSLTVVLNNPMVAGVLTMGIIVVGYILIAGSRAKKRLGLLEEECDPQGFLDATEQQRAITGRKPRMSVYFDIDKAAGLIELGEFQQAKEVLASIDKTLLSAKNGTKLVYMVNSILCAYELGDLEEGEKLFETEVPLTVPINTRMSETIEYLMADRYFFLGRYEESKEKFDQLLQRKTSRRKRVEILYRLALMEEKAGDLDGAKKKFEEVSKEGGKLWVAKQAVLHLNGE